MPSAVLIGSKLGAVGSKLESRCCVVSVSYRVPPESSEVSKLRSRRSGWVYPAAGGVSDCFDCALVSLAFEDVSGREGVPSDGLCALALPLTLVVVSINRSFMVSYLALF